MIVMIVAPARPCRGTVASRDVTVVIVPFVGLAVTADQVDLLNVDARRSIVLVVVHVVVVIVVYGIAAAIRRELILDDDLTADTNRRDNGCSP